MRINWLEPNKKTWVWPKEGVPAEDQITFHIKKLEDEDRTRIEDCSMRWLGTPGTQAEMMYAHGTAKKIAIFGSITGWENVLDQDGAPRPFNQDNLKYLLRNNGGVPRSVAILDDEIYAEILRFNHMSAQEEADQKNLPSES